VWPWFSGHYITRELAFRTSELENQKAIQQLSAKGKLNENLFKGKNSSKLSVKSSLKLPFAWFFPFLIPLKNLTLRNKRTFSFRSNETKLL